MDPLRPFVDLIRSLRAVTRSGAASGQSAAQRRDSSPSETPAAAGAQSVEARLQAQLAALGEWSSPRARELFVQHTLLAELGEELARDPAFGDLVRRVSSELAHVPRLSERLDQLLRDLAAAGLPRDSLRDALPSGREPSGQRP